MMSVTKGDNQSDAASIERRVSVTVNSLRAAVAAVLDTLPHKPQRPLELARALGLNKSICSRLARALRTPDPLACAHLMPGSEGLRTVLLAAGEHGAPGALLRAASTAVNELDHVVNRCVGGRAALEALISDTVPQARGRFELANKQAMFKAVSSLKGISVSTYFRSYLLHAGNDPERIDYAMLLGLLGLQRMRPRAVVQVADVHDTAEARADARLTLDGLPVDGIDSLLLHEYCSVPPPQLVTRHVGASMYYLLESTRLGPSSAVDVTIAELNRGFYRRHEEVGKERLSGAGAEVDQPAKTLVLDVLVHDDIWMDRAPELRIYDMAVRGPADPNEPERDIDLLNLHESIEFLGRDASRFRMVEVPNYVDMLRYVCHKVGWDERRFRGYRCRIQYPFYGSQICLTFAPRGGLSEGPVVPEL